MGNKGQGAIEALLALPIILASCCLLGQLSYRAGFYLMASYYAEEALLCSANSRTVVTCEVNLRKKIRRLAIFKENYQVKLSRTYYRSTVLINAPQMRFERSLQLPLERNIR